MRALVPFSRVKSEPTQERSRETVRAVLEAANLEFGEHGFHAARITNIAKRAGVSVGSLYRFFPDKDSLGSAITQAYLDAVAERYLPIAHQLRSYDDIPTVIERLVEAASDLQIQHPGYYRMTNDVSPVEEQWIGHGVRSVLVSEFSSIIARLGLVAVEGGPQPPTVIEFVIETVRCRLTSIPTIEEHRTEHLTELSHGHRLPARPATTRRRPRTVIGARLSSSSS